MLSEKGSEREKQSERVRELEGGKRRRGWEEAVLGVRKSQCAARRASCRTSWFYPRWATNLPRNITARSSLQNGTAKIRDYIPLIYTYMYIHLCVQLLQNDCLSHQPLVHETSVLDWTAYIFTLLDLLSICPNTSTLHQPAWLTTSLSSFTFFFLLFLLPVLSYPSYTSCIVWQRDGRDVGRNYNRTILEHPSGHWETSFTLLDVISAPYC